MGGNRGLYIALPFRRDLIVGLDATHVLALLDEPTLRMAAALLDREREIGDLRRQLDRLQAQLDKFQCQK